ncbi:hypothetical protein BDY24DRAFT_443400 [Mrakia frigida]|uniref:uncharacterized protein n=1 Tax=Mrakia frigida TaxID=29902 RepID=UPI003FCC2266
MNSSDLHLDKDQSPSSHAPAALVEPSLPSNPSFAPPRPPPSPASSSSLAPIPAPALSFPFNHPTELRLFFDPTSTQATKLSEKLQTICQTLEKSPPFTLNPEEATHLVLEQATELNQKLREEAQAHQHLVSARWIVRSTFSREPLDEQDFAIEGHGDGDEEELEDEEAEEEPMEGIEEEEEQEEGGGSRLRTATVKTNALSWSDQEHENLAQHLAERIPPYSRSDFKDFGSKHERRTHEAYARRYRARREFFDRRIAEIQGVDYVEKDEEENPFSDGKPRAIYNDDDDESSEEESEERLASGAESYDSAEENNSNHPLRQRYTVKENSDLVRLLSQNSTSRAEAFRLFCQLHPHRNPTSITSQYYHNRALYDPAISQHQQRGSDVDEMASPVPRGRGRSSHEAWTKTENRDLVGLLATMMNGNKADVFREMIKKHPDRSYSAVKSHYREYRAYFDKAVEKFKRREAKSQQKRVDALDDSKTEGDRCNEPPTPPHRTSTLPSTSNSQHSHGNGLKRASSSVGSSKTVRVDDASNPFPARAPINFHGSQLHHHQQQHASSSFHSHQAPQPSAPPSPSSTSSSSQNDHALPLEPPSFLRLGARPSACSLNEQYCYLCGFFGRRRPVTFELLQLVRRNERNDGARTIEARLGCDGCARIYHRRFDAQEVEGLSAMEKIGYASACVIEDGLEIRREAVDG